MVLLEFAMAPHGQGESLSAYVARILDVIDKSGVPYQLTPMGTILEGEWEDVMGVVTACFKSLQADCLRPARLGGIAVKVLRATSMQDAFLKLWTVNIVLT